MHEAESPAAVRAQSPAAGRLTATLFGGVALASTAYIAMATLSSIAIDDLTGSASLAGVPGATAVVGTAVGTTVLSLGVARRGRRPGLIGGYTAAALGAVVAGLAVITRSVALLFVGMALVGLGNAASHLARYASADLYVPTRRATALAWVVWGSTIGSVAGPTLLGPAGRIAESVGRSELLGGYAIGAGFMALAALLYFVALRPDPARVAVEQPTERRIVFADITTAFRSSSVKAGLSAMVAGQVVMVMIMTATPLHVHHHGSDLGSVGVVMSAHTLGMFALAPLVGRIVDRVGGLKVALLGMAALGVAALGAAYGPNETIPGLVVTLWLLGLGWNMTFVAGSSTLVTGLDPGIRARVQGTADSLTWLSSAVSAVAAGLLYQAADYRTLGLIGLALLAAPLLVVLRHRPAPTPA
ncbi:MAG TPA: MFS transporter [Acidimicrobiia bacterium]